VFHIIKLLFDETKYGGWVAGIAAGVTFAVFALGVNPVEHLPPGCVHGQALTRNEFGQQVLCINQFYPEALIWDLGAAAIGGFVGVIIAAFLHDAGVPKEKLGMRDD
jgi:hypothetical protein